MQYQVLIITDIIPGMRYSRRSLVSSKQVYSIQLYSAVFQRKRFRDPISNQNSTSNHHVLAVSMYPKIDMLCFREKKFVCLFIRPSKLL